MTFKMKSMPLAISYAIASGALSVAVMNPALALAQTQTQAETPAMQRVVVTGSLISRTDKETPSPVQVLTAADIAKSGYTSVAEVLSHLASNGQGSLGTGFAGAFANGGSGVSLRGMTVGLTLVLIDGHRMAPYPLSDDAQRQFVDVSAIPFDAIDRIEVLKDGASAVYGSDAIAGVVNVILKKSFNGTSINTDVGNSQHGGGRTYKVAVTSGIGDLQEAGWNAFVSAEYRHADAIKLSQRDNYDWANGDWRGRGGNDLRRGAPTTLNSFLTATSSPFFYNPTGTDGATNAANFQFLDPSCNFDKYRAGACAIRDAVSFLQPESHNVNLLAGFTKKLGDDWQLALKASMFKRNSLNNRGVPATFSPTSFAGSTALVPGENPRIVNVYGSTVFPANYPLNRLGAPARLYGYIPGLDPANTQDNTSTATRFVADLTGSFMGWELLAAAGITQVKTESDYSGYVNRTALYQSLNNADPAQRFNPLGGNSPAMLESISPHFSNEASSKLNFFELQGQRELFQMAGGPLSIATGVSWKKKTLDAPSPSLLATGTVGSGAAYSSGKETNTAAFAELGGNVIKGLELSVNARYDHYDTYGNSFTPGAKFKWSPIQMVSVRGTFAKGFRAPNSAEVGTASSLFQFHAINDPVLCKDGNRNTAGNVPAACSFTPAFVQVTTPDLKPEKSKSYTLGLILEPVKNLSATVDYYNIEVNNQINTAAGLPGFVPSFVRNAPFPVDIADGNGGTYQGTPAVGTVAYATSGYVNSGGTSTRGVELDLSYRLKLASGNNLRGNLTLNHMISYELDSAGEKYELAGTHGPSVISGNTGNPKNRAQLTLGWDRGPLAVTSTVNWVDSFSALDPSIGANNCASVAEEVGGRTYFSGQTMPLSYCKIASFTTTDLNVTYKVNSNLTLKGSILNVFDRQPPFDVATYGNANNLTSYNPSLHQAGAVGRFFSLGANYTF